MKKLIIHPKDPSTDFLKIFYLSESAITECPGNSKLRKMIQEAEEIWLLGYGTEWGLLDMHSKFGVLEIVGSRYAEFLRNKKVIGIWCNANIFAEKYKLTGLFSGMVISEMQEALDWNIQTTEEEIEKENLNFAKDLSNCIKYADHLSEVPEMMRKRLEKEDCSDLVKFNYESIYWIEDGSTPGD
jgi:hypothetical protein